MMPKASLAGLAAAVPPAAEKKTFVKAVEYWVPSRDRSCLEYGGGLYGTATRFAAISRTLCFARGEGLPGQAWEAGRPIVLRQFVGSYFRRTSAAHAEGLTCAIALPIFAGEFLTSVLVIFCGDDEEHAGAIELWHNDPALSKDMTLVDGHYGNTGDAFEFISRRTSFRRGHGLPGLSWEHGMPVFLDDLGKASGFLRGNSALKVGINRGFAVPCQAGQGETYVLAFLSALATPIARRVEVWERVPGQLQLRRTSGHCERLGSLTAPSAHPAAPLLERGQGTIGQAFLTGVPHISNQADSEPLGLGAQAAAAGLKSLVAVPVIRDGCLVACMAWYF